MRDTESNRYLVQHWRTISESTVDAMDDFLFWLEYDLSSPDISEEEKEIINKIKALVDLYLGRDSMKKVEQGEQELLDAWSRDVEESVIHALQSGIKVPDTTLQSMKYPYNLTTRQD